MAVEVFAADEQSDEPVDLARWTALAERVLEVEGIDVDAEVGLVFLDEAAMAKLNEQFHGEAGSTDVLSFPIDEEPRESGRHPDSGGSGPGEPIEPDDLPVLLGDVYICPAVAARNAPGHAGTYDDELALLVVHGLLHLLGMDHDDGGEAEEMEAREREHLDRFRGVVDASVQLTPRARGPWLPPRSPSSMTLDRLRSAGPARGATDGDPPPEPPSDEPPSGGPS